MKQVVKFVECDFDEKADSYYADDSDADAYRRMSPR